MYFIHPRGMSQERMQACVWFGGPQPLQTVGLFVKWLLTKLFPPAALGSHFSSCVLICCVFQDFFILLTGPVQVRVPLRGLHSGSHSRHVLLTSHSRGSLLKETQLSLFRSNAIRDTACSSVTTDLAPEHSVRLLRHVWISASGQTS